MSKRGLKQASRAKPHPKTLEVEYTIEPQPFQTYLCMANQYLTAIRILVTDNHGFVEALWMHIRRYALPAVPGCASLIYPFQATEMPPWRQLLPTKALSHLIRKICQVGLLGCWIVRWFSMKCDPRAHMYGFLTKSWLLCDAIASEDCDGGVGTCTTLASTISSTFKKPWEVWSSDLESIAKTFSHSSPLLKLRKERWAAPVAQSRHCYEPLLASPWHIFQRKLLWKSKNIGSVTSALWDHVFPVKVFHVHLKVSLPWSMAILLCRQCRPLRTGASHRWEGPRGFWHLPRVWDIWYLAVNLNTECFCWYLITSSSCDFKFGQLPIT